MKAWLRSVNESIKPRFMPGGTQAKWFPIYDAIENFIFSSTHKNNKPHSCKGFDRHSKDLSLIHI